MNDVDQVKRRARKLRSLLSDCACDIGHSQCLEILAQLEDYRDWNTFAAAMRSNATRLSIPEGWTIGGDAAPFYDVGVVEDRRGKHARYAEISDRSDPTYNGAGFVTLMQSIDAAHYAGHRVRLGAALRAIGCTGAVTLWMRVDDVTGGNMLAFDNMENREANGPLTGTTDWVDRDIVLDVPAGAELLNFGFYLRGLGSAQAAEFSLDTVSDQYHTTDVKPKRPTQPLNLSLR